MENTSKNYIRHIDCKSVNQAPEENRPRIPFQLYERGLTLTAVKKYIAELESKNADSLDDDALADRTERLMGLDRVNRQLSQVYKEIFGKDHESE